MNYLSAVCIAKDEPDLEEWVRYHQLIGVEKFFIFDHKSAQPIEQQLAPLIASKLVTVIRATGQYPQVPLYEWALKNHQPTSRWLAFIDADEFLVPKQTDDLRTLLRDYEQFGGLGVHWLLFGSSGHEKRPPGLMMENYTRRSSKSYDLNQHVKSIVQPARATGTINPHFFHYAPPYFAVNEFGVPFDSPVSYPHTSERVQFNHYYLKSREEFLKKAARGVPCSPDRADPRWFDERNAHCNAEPDETILRFLPKLKAAMRR